MTIRIYSKLGSKKKMICRRFMHDSIYVESYCWDREKRFVVRGCFSEIHVTIYYRTWDIDRLNH